MIGVSITYTIETKGAISSDIFRLRMGLQFARRRPENIRAGFLYKGPLIFTRGHNKYPTVELLFNLLWRPIIARENELLDSLSQYDEASDEAALISNDIVYLRLCKKDLQDKAQKPSFSDGAFSIDDGYIDLADL
jgi:hypothetical protein